MLARFFIDRPVLAWVISIIILLLGAISAGFLPIAEYPEITPPTVRLTSEAFGRENTGVVYGWIGASHQLGASMAALGAGTIRSMAGDYSPAFWIAGTLCLIAGLSFVTIGRSALRPREALAYLTWTAPRSTGART